MKVRKKKKSTKLFWLLVDLAVVAFVCALLLYKPARYDPVEAAGGKQVCPYLTHDLLAPLHNGSQRGQPFNLVVTQKGINEVVAWSKWPKESQGAVFSAPAVVFDPKGIVLMGTVVLQDVQFVVTIVLKPELDDRGLLNLTATAVKVGAMNITLLARLIAKRMYHQRVTTVPIDKQDWRAKIAASLLNDEPFEPVFEVEGDRFLIKEIALKHKTLILRLHPLSNAPPRR